MPPGPDMFGAILTAEAAAERGLHPYRAPTGVNSVPYDDRPACNNCGFCGGYGCAIHAKGDPISSLRRALRTGRCEVRPECYVAEIVLDRIGPRATGVRYLDIASADAARGAGAPRRPRGRRVRDASAAAAIRASATRRTSSDATSCTTSRRSPSASSRSRLHGERGRSVTHLHDDFMVPDDDAMAAAARPTCRGSGAARSSTAAADQPLMEAMTYPPGPQHNRSMRDSAIRDRLFAFTMQAEDLPQPTNRIDLDPTIVDAWGFAAGRVTYAPHEHELVASDHFAPYSKR